MKPLNDAEKLFRERSARAKFDLLGAIYNSNVIDLLQLDVRDTEGERMKWRELESYISEKGIEKGVAGEIMELVNAYAGESDEHGFRKGFHVAMRMCMEGMRP